MFIISSLSAFAGIFTSGRRRLEQAARLIREAKPGEEIVLPEGVYFELLPDDDAHDANDGERNPDSNKSDTRRFRPARATCLLSLHPIKAIKM
ncbi:hypothetical protein FHS85_002895 [Rhodoligotrophos appendicifer]|uniref:hypothetical protein n=1 Tax=Rhodoligotrophos appendicifer TaxID=987056 RepID=UPI001186CD55|nr:hypothetical protein [Rhodoligotrophos appendicifer]